MDRAEWRSIAKATSTLATPATIVCRSCRPSASRPASGATGSQAGEFRQPYGVALDRDGFVYVADHWNNRIQKLSPSGEAVAQWGSYGWGSGQFNNPRALAVDGRGDVYVADSFNHRIQKMSATGLPDAEWGRRGGAAAQFRRPEGLVVDDHGGIVVVDADNVRLQSLYR